MELAGIDCLRNRRRTQKSWRMEEEAEREGKGNPSELQPRGKLQSSRKVMANLKIRHEIPSTKIPNPQTKSPKKSFQAQHVFSNTRTSPSLRFPCVLSQLTKPTSTIHSLSSSFPFCSVSSSFSISLSSPPPTLTFTNRGSQFPSFVAFSSSFSFSFFT